MTNARSESLIMLFSSLCGLIDVFLFNVMFTRFKVEVFFHEEIQFSNILARNKSLI